MQWYYRLHWLFLRFLFKLYFGYRSQGSEHVPADGPILLAANHTSFLDPPIISLSINRQTTFLGKEELFSIPLLGWWIKSLGTYPVKRGVADLRAVKTVIRFLKEGKAMIMFPEGTRSSDGNLMDFQDGLAWLSLKTNAPIAPVMIEGAFRAMPRGVFFPKPRRIRVQLGPCVRPTPEELEGDQTEAIRAITKRLHEAMSNMQDEIRS